MTLNYYLNLKIFGTNALFLKKGKKITEIKKDPIKNFDKQFPYQQLKLQEKYPFLRKLLSKHPF